MAIEIVCDDCGNNYRVSDDKAGSRVRCKECGSRIDVPDGNGGDVFDDAPVRTRSGSRSGSNSSSGSSAPRKKRKGSSGPPLGVIIGVGAVAAVMVIGLALFAMLGGGGGGAPQVAQNNPAPLPNSVPVGVPPTPANAVPSPAPASTFPPSTPAAQPANNVPNTNVAANTPAPASTLPSSTPAAGLPSSTPAAGLPSTKNAGPLPPAAAAAPGAEVAQGGPAAKKKFGGFAGGDAGAADVPGDAPANDAGVPDAPLPDLWKVTVDPSKLADKIDPAKPITIKFPKGAGHTDILFPVTPSVCVALGENSISQQVREVWNLATKTKIGTITSNLVHPGATSALSPDGQHLASAMVLKQKEGVMVWTTKTGKLLGELETGSSVTVVMFPSADRLVAICDDGSAKVWKLPSGDVEHDLVVDKAETANNVTASPGGKYLATVGDKSSLKMFDLDTGELAGELVLPFAGVFFAGKPDALAFSPDGQVLGMVMPTGVFEKVFVVYNVADGKLLTKVDLNVKDLGHSADRAQGNRLEWFPDRTKLLWRGHYILDAKLGGPVWRAPEEDGSSDAPRKLLDGKRILVVAGGRQNPVLKTPPIPLDEINASAKIVAAGGEASDAGLPQITKADATGFDPIAVGAVGAWTMQPDGAPAGKGVKASIAIPKDRPSIGGIYISRPDVGRAVVWYSDSVHAFFNNASKAMHRHNGVKLPGGAGSVQVDVFDLAAGKLQGSFPLGYPSTVLDVSQDGTLLAARTTKPNDERIDVYGTNGKPVAGWRPYQTQSDGPKGVTDAVVLDAEHCVTRNQTGVTYLWKLPECKAVWRIQNASNFCLSPGGKYLGFQVDQRYLFMEARTGTLVAEMPVQMPKFACAFHPVGTHLAVLSADGVSHKVTILDIATGKSTADFYVPQGNDWVQWCGDAHLLLDEKWLVDLKQQKNAWQYNLASGAHARTQPDGRHWFIAAGAFNDPKAFLTSAALPEPAVLAKIDAAQLPDESLLKPGLQMGLQINLAATSQSHPNLLNDVVANFKTGLKNNGFVEAQGSPMSLVISTTQSNPNDEPMKFRNFGPGGVNADVPVVNVVCEVALLSSGQTLWKNTATMSNKTFGIVFLPPGEEVGSHLSKQMWNQVAAHLTKFPVPKQVFGQTAGAGLGKSAFVAGGTQPEAN